MELFRSEISDLDISKEIFYFIIFFILFTLQKYIINYVFLGHFTYPKISGITSTKEKVLEESYLAFWCSFLSILSWYILFNNKTGCHVFNTHLCVRNWPRIPKESEVLFLMRIETGWYIHQLLRTIMKFGAPFETLMFYHHLITIAIIFIGYYKNLFLTGILTLAVLNTSNPFLHISKIAYVLNMSMLKVVLFCLFGFVFFCTRVVLMPMTVLKIALIDSWKEDLDRFGRRFHLMCNVLMMILYVFQIHWMHRIIRVLKGGKTGSSPVKNQNKSPFANGIPDEIKFPNKTY